MGVPVMLLRRPAPQPVPVPEGSPCPPPSSPLCKGGLPLAYRGNQPSSD